tara:strand:- start:6979 stop:7428 length:450 start_codon:yes stop_codon:yes gene_type:complete
MKIKEVSILDSNEIYQWRNDRSTRLMSKNSKKIDKASHNKWIHKCLKSNDYHLYLGIYNGVKVGIVWFLSDSKKKESEVSINLNPEERGKKLSTMLLQKCINIFLKKNKLSLRSTIKKNNYASKKIFQNCNFTVKKSDETYDYLFLEKN